MKQSSLGSPIALLRTVRVGSQSAPKLEAVRSALLSYAPTVEVIGHAVDSGVPDQPVGWSEIKLGAYNRAHAALKKGDCELAVGIEDGLVKLEELDGEVLNVGVALVTDGKRQGFGLSSGFAYPNPCVAPALYDREPIGGVFDGLWASRFGQADGVASSESIGNIGKLTLGVLGRSEYGRHAVLCALIRFLHPEWYAGDGRESRK